MKKFIFNRKGTTLFSLIFLFSFFFLVSAVSAVPAVNPQTIVTGYDIKIPQDNILEAGQDYDFEFHVANISDGVPITTNLNCSFHLYNHSGKHIFEGFQATATHDFDYGFHIDGENFTYPGVYYYNIQCWSPADQKVGAILGGHDASIIYVTTTGFMDLQWFYLLILAISGGIIVLGFSLKDPTLVIFGSFGLYFIALYILFNGIVGVKDLVTTWAIGLIILGVAFYISIKAALELIAD